MLFAFSPHFQTLSSIEVAAQLPHRGHHRVPIDAAFALAVFDETLLRDDELHREEPQEDESPHHYLRAE
jgi:hypothetical protein